VIITALPPIAVAVFETDISVDIIEKYPQCYERTQSDTVFTWKTLSLWFISATYQSLVLFFGAYFMWDDGLAALNGQQAGFYTLGNAILIVGIFVISLKLVLFVNNWNWVVHLTVWGSILIYLVLVILENSILYLFPHQFFVFFNMCSIPIIYLWILGATIACLLPDLVIAYFQRTFFPQNWQILQEMKKGDKKKGKDSILAGTKTYGIFNRGISPTDREVHASDSAGNGKDNGRSSPSLGGYSRLDERLIDSDGEDEDVVED